MLKLIGSAALAALLAIAPASSVVGLAGAAQPASFVTVVAPPQAPRSVPLTPVQVEAPPVESAHGHSHDSDLAPGQARADYLAWLARSPEHRAEVAAFRAHLASEGLDDVVPVWQLIRTSSSWRDCAAQPFEVAPADKWEHISDTLRFVRDEVVPAVGEVEALSAYRNDSLNACSAGAPKSAHRMFFALDLTPVAADISRDRMIRSVCSAHGRHGRDYDAGLGFYSGRRFHVDSSGFRKWGPDGSGATSPCVA